VTIRFLGLAESAVPGAPFVPGQVIEVATLTPEIQAALRSNLAELVRAEEPDLATVGVTERAVTRTARRRVSR
jgi:hypothetical protein